ncbi:hypothetical protein ASF88_18200 [Leifsonia sp. Leaf336]|uniref:hypothetical protein n=1 Tax=Leifsonia sp. Leaf336 TaxID=1736341 RepID=UPI0006FBBED3|nr:hypothetical protein [Leifsonia sp. Leaf336]KQR51119.1 hypothetical protein ASF88_18200 [Leifsonia sp. Leaf336]
MNTILLSLLQGAGPVAFAVVSFALAFTWPRLIESVGRLGSERARLTAYLSLGLVLLLAGAVVYVVPGVLLADELGAIVALPVVATWAIVSAALVVRATLQTGVERVVSASFAIVAVCGAAAGILITLSGHHAIAATILPTGAFVLVVSAIAALIGWARVEPAIDGASA